MVLDELEPRTVVLDELEAGELLDRRRLSPLGFEPLTGLRNIELFSDIDPDDALS